MKSPAFFLSALFLVFLFSCSPQTENNKSQLMATLSDQYNTPDGCTVSETGDIIMSVPNFNNADMLKKGMIKAEYPACMVKIDMDNNVETWYQFKEEDLHPLTGKVGPMGCDFGPDGNLYVADNQVNYDANNESRLLRINVVDGKPVSCDVIAEGFVVSNAVIWRGNTLYVAETVLVPTTSEGAMGAIYAFQMDDWADGPVQLETYSDSPNDPHLIETFKSSGRVGFSTDGLTFDGQGNLYSSIFEDGIIYKTTLDESGDVIETILFAEDENMASADGIFWNKSDDKIYVADMLNNAVQVVDMEGNVTTLHENGDTDGADGSLDQPCEVVIRGNQLIVVNMDWYFESEYLVNTKTERPFTLTEIEL